VSAHNSSGSSHSSGIAGNAATATTLAAGSVLSVLKGGTGVATLAELAANLGGNGMARIAVFQYTGTGTYGAANPTVIPIHLTSRIVIIQKASGVAASHSLIAITQVGSAITIGDNPGVNILTWNFGSTLSFYNADSAAQQMNTSGSYYNVIEIY
jgi:hypothetical protein